MTDQQAASEIARLRDTLSEMSVVCVQAANEKDTEITRLRRWLGYIEGNHSDHREAASAALAGEPLPETYND